MALLALVAAGAVAPARPAAAATQPTMPPAWVEVARAEDARNWSDGTLRRHLGAGDPALRARAALAAGRLQDTLAIASLLPLLRDASSEVRSEAIFALGQIGFAHTTSPAARAMRDPLAAALAGADAGTTALLVEALGKLQDKGATAAVAARLGHADAQVRAHAAVALWWLADSTAVDALVAHHDDPVADTRWRILYALEKVVAPEKIVLVAALHVSDDDPQVRAQAVRTIGRQRAVRGTAYALQLFGDPDVNVAVNAVRAVQQIADSTSARVAPALARLLGHAHPYVRVTAATALAERFAWHGADSAARAHANTALHAALRDDDPATRAAAGRALLLRDGVAALDSVRAGLADSSLYVRVPLLQAVATLPSATARPLLLAHAGRDRHLFERMTALEALGEAGGREALPVLREALGEREPLIVASAASALAAARDSASVPRLIAAYAARAGAADADARIALRDAVRELAGDRRADSLERAHPASRPPAPDADVWATLPTEHGVILATSRGEIEWAFEVDHAPQTVRNFVTLAKRGTFDGTAFHRVVPNFVIQDGDPTGTGSGGPGYSIRCEYNRLRYEPGRVGMALSGKDTGGSQWFITHSPQPHLNGRYTIFGRVVRGMDVVRAIRQGDRIHKVTVIP